jgi:hypothetical protein
MENQWKPVKKLPDDYQETQYTYDPLISWVALVKFGVWSAGIIAMIAAIRLLLGA